MKTTAWTALSWNIQWGLGMDGRVSLARIRDEVRRMGDADIVCLQEVACGFDDLRGFHGEDQFAQLREVFLGYEVAEFRVVDMPGPRGRLGFGNAVLSRWPMAQVLRHTLPWHSVGGECMPRGALEVVVLAPWGPLRVMTTHLEWSSPELRAPQVEALRGLQQAACARLARPPSPAAGGYRVLPGSAESLLCGDFNMPPEDPLVARLQAGFEDHSTRPWVDAWRHRHGGVAHPPSMEVHAGPSASAARCLDYLFVTPGLAACLQEVRYDAISNASDHQPVWARFEGAPRA